MLDIKFIRDNPDLVKDGIRKKYSSVDIDQILDVDRQRREILTELEQLRERRNRCLVTSL